MSLCAQAQTDETWVPTGALDKRITYDCDPRVIEKNYLALPNSDRSRPELLQNRVNACETQWRVGTESDTWADYQKLRRVQYSSQGEPSFMQNIEFRLPFNQYLQGSLALQNVNERRALVVAVCDATDCSSLKAFMMQLFDEAPFHVLVLESHASLPYWRRNRQISLGGYFEAQQLVSLGRWLRLESSFRGKINSLHLLGVGFSAHSALLASRLNDSNPINSDTRVYQSVVALSAAVDLRSAFQRLERNTNMTNAFRTQFLNQGEATREFLRDPFDLHRNWQARNWWEGLAAASARSFSRFDDRLFLLPFQDESIQDRVTLWKRNDFREISAGSRTPTLIWSAADDPLFENNRQLELLREKHRQKMGRLSFLNWQQGGYQSFSTHHEWMVASRVLRAFFLGNSYDVWMKREQVALKARLPALELEPGELIYSQSWGLSLDGQSAELNIRIGPNSRLWNASWPLTSLGLRPAETAEGRARLIRQLNANFEAHGPSGLSVDTTIPPTQILRWE